MGKDACIKLQVIPQDFPVAGSCPLDTAASSLSRPTAAMMNHKDEKPEVTKSHGFDPIVGKTHVFDPSAGKTLQNPVSDTPVFAHNQHVLLHPGQPPDC